RKPVGMVDAKPLEEAVVHELEHLRMHHLEYLRELDPTAAEPAYVEEAAVPARPGVCVEEAVAQLRVGPEAVLFLGGRHVVRDDVEDDAEPCGAGGLAEPTELCFTAEVIRDTRWIDDVVAVGRAPLRLEGR